MTCHVIAAMTIYRYILTARGKNWISNSKWSHLTTVPQFQYYRAVFVLSLSIPCTAYSHALLSASLSLAHRLGKRERTQHAAVAATAAIEEASKRLLPRCCPCPLGRRSQPNARRCNCRTDGQGRFKNLFMFLVIVTYFVVAVAVAVADVVEFNLYSRPRIQRPQENKTKYLFGFVCLYDSHAHTHRQTQRSRCYGRVSAHLFTFFNAHPEYTNNKFYFTCREGSFTRKKNLNWNNLILLYSLLCMNLLTYLTACKQSSRYLS